MTRKPWRFWSHESVQSEALQIRVFRWIPSVGLGTQLVMTLWSWVGDAPWSSMKPPSRSWAKKRKAASFGSSQTGPGPQQVNCWSNLVCRKWCHDHRFSFTFCKRIELGSYSNRLQLGNNQRRGRTLNNGRSEESANCKWTSAVKCSEDLEKLSAFFEEKIDPMDELPYRSVASAHH